jgi:GT2 family glycosyltransferase
MIKYIAVLLTCHNRKEKTLSCLNALFQCTLPDGYKFEVFLVDDNSTDGTSEATKERFPLVNIIQGDGNLYWNRGMHLAWETASKTNDYDYYLWLNDDTMLLPNAVNELIQCAEKENNKSIICGTSCDTQNKNILTYGGHTKKNGLIKPNGKMQYCEFFNGNIVIVPNYVFAKVGMNDNRFRHAFGDFDYGIRAQKQGICLIVAPNILGKCDEHENLATWCNPQKSFRERWKHFRSPLGQNPEEFFVYEKRRKGFFIAFFRYLTNHLRVCFPKIWENV